MSTNLERSGRVDARNDLIQILLAIILPPLGVFFQVGLGWVTLRK